jgi:hypothetical protein
MSSRFRFPVALTAALAVTAMTVAAAPARAEENVLHGPHPFLRDNELAAHVLIAKGYGDTPGGAKLALDYGYKVVGGSIPTWLALAVNIQRSDCTTAGPSPSCGPQGGSIFETLGGLRWQFATPIPLVPYIAGAVGVAFSFPEIGHAAAGFTGRVVGGANYFIFDWFALGGQVGVSLGHLNYDSTVPGSRTYSVLDLGGGAEFMF